ncbi:hypothetical protein HLB23_39325 [Nocardia uniformis]|uniref:Bacterial transcriptional activator domain-containing protein n=1 Tax=Nocardia uniformis TaxID=53432 RepID=A0A849CI37_9NOCA|nr:hypothetical protein [Nocardia uniformis]NNH75839.1 hypothetical protein [Nocardia uniformis]
MNEILLDENREPEEIVLDDPEPGPAPLELWLRTHTDTPEGDTGTCGPPASSPPRRRWRGVAGGACVLGLAAAAITTVAPDPHPQVSTTPASTTAASSTSSDHTGVLVSGTSSGCAHSATEQQIVAAATTSAPVRDGAQAIAVFEAAYYRLRDGARARRVVAGSAAIPDASAIQAGIDSIPVGTTYCAHIRRLHVGLYAVEIHERRPTSPKRYGGNRSRPVISTGTRGSPRSRTCDPPTATEQVRRAADPNGTTDSARVFRRKVVVAMLIAVAGLEPATGASTTALLLAAAWPTGQPVIVVEADPRGGQLARRCGGDPARGLASLTAAAGESGVRGLADLGAHLQWHPAGVAYLAAPEHLGHLAAALTQPHGFDGPGLARTWGPTGELVVVADCGLAARDSVVAPLLDSADLLLLVVSSQRRPTAPLTARGRELAARYPRLAIALTGTPPHAQDPRARATELGAPVVGRLPAQHALTTEQAPGPAMLRSRDTGAAAHALAAAVQARAASIRDASTAHRPSPRWRAPRRSPGRDRLHLAVPQVYAISTCRPTGEPAHQQLAPTVAATASPQHTSSPPDLGPPPPVQPVASVTTPESDAPRPAAAAPCAPHPAGPATSHPSLVLRLFGPVRVIWRPPQGTAGQTASEIEITARLQPRSREALVLLATHPHGLTRAQLVDALWGPQRPQRPTNALCITLARLRTTVAAVTGETGAPLLDTSSGRYRLNPAAVSTDYAEFSDALARRRHTTDDAERHRAAARILELAASGTLAADLDTEFLDPIRYRARCEAITSIGILVPSFSNEDPGLALRLLETAIDIEPHNEHLYRNMLKLYDSLGQHYAIDNTIGLLARRLAEIGERPSRRIRELARQLEDKAS